MPVVCEELRRLARPYMSRECSDHTRQATAVVAVVNLTAP